MLCTDVYFDIVGHSYVLFRKKIDIKDLDSILQKVGRRYNVVVSIPLVTEIL